MPRDYVLRRMLRRQDRGGRRSRSFLQLRRRLDGILPERTDLLRLLRSSRQLTAQHRGNWKVDHDKDIKARSEIRKARSSLKAAIDPLSDPPKPGWDGPDGEKRVEAKATSGSTRAVHQRPASRLTGPTTRGRSARRPRLGRPNPRS